LTWPALLYRAILYTLTPTFIWPLICLIEFLNACHPAPCCSRGNLGECFLFRFECQWHAISTSTRAVAPCCWPLCTPVSPVSTPGHSLPSSSILNPCSSALSNYVPKYVDGHVVARMPECQFYMSFLITVSIVCSTALPPPSDFHPSALFQPWKSQQLRTAQRGHSSVAIMTSKPVFQGGEEIAISGPRSARNISTSPQLMHMHWTLHLHLD